ncbi:unnamed protein product [Lampetra planeri]
MKLAQKAKPGGGSGGAHRWRPQLARSAQCWVVTSSPNRDLQLQSDLRLGRGWAVAAELSCQAGLARLQRRRGAA